jgi:DNA-binding NarL/FixJ family response regulator
MPGRGTLVVSRMNELFPQFKMYLENLGFKGVTVTDVEKDGLNMIIDEMKPWLLLIESDFYYCSTPFMMRRLLKRFPELNIAAVSIAKYPDDKAMAFIANGVKSYVDVLLGAEEFRKGLAAVRDGRSYVSPKVVKRIEMRPTDLKPAGEINEKFKELINLLYYGFQESEIADTLHLSRRTVDFYKTEIFTTLNVRSTVELMRVADELGIIEKDGVCFYPKNYTINPVPENKIGKRRKEC